MTHADFFGLQRFQNIGGQFQNAQIIAHRAAALAHPLAEALVRVGELIDEALVGGGHFHGVEVGAHEVFDQRHFEHALVVGDANVGGHTFFTGQLTGAQAALPADELKLPLGQLPHRNGLDEAVHLDALAQFVELRGVELFARLVGVHFDLGYRNFGHRIGQRLHQLLLLFGRLFAGGQKYTQAFAPAELRAHPGGEIGFGGFAIYFSGDFLCHGEVVCSACVVG